MKKIIIAGLLVALLVPPISAAALGEAFTEDQRSTNAWCVANYPAAGLTGITSGSLNKPSGLVCDVLTARDNLKKLIETLQRLLALRAQLQALLDARGGNGGGDDDNGGTDPVVNTTKAKFMLTGLKAHYAPGEAVSFKLNAKARETSTGNTLDFSSSCQTSYKLYKNGSATAVYDSLAAVSCAQATSTVTLPKDWSITHNAAQYALGVGSYRLEAQVTGYATLNWYFKVLSPNAPVVSINLLTPAVNQLWATSSSNTVTWGTVNASSSDQVEIRLIPVGNTLDSLVNSTLIASSINDGIESIKIPDTLAAGNYRLVLKLTSGGVTFTSPQMINIVVPAPGNVASAPFINSLSTYSAATGTSLTINGLYFVTGDNVISFAGTNVATSSATNGQITITVPNLAAGNYAIKVANANGISNAVNFTILSAPIVTPVATVITVTTPSSDTVEEWVAGTLHPITWTSSPTKDNGGVSTVNIRLVDPVTNLVQDLALYVPNTGSYSWQVGKLASGVSVTGRYRIRVCPVGLGDCDKGNKNIKIVPASGAKVSEGSTLQVASTAAVLQGLVEQLNGLLRLR